MNIFRGCLNAERDLSICQLNFRDSLKSGIFSHKHARISILPSTEQILSNPIEDESFFPSRT